MAFDAASTGDGAVVLGWLDREMQRRASSSRVRTIRPGGEGGMQPGILPQWAAGPLTMGSGQIRSGSPEKRTHGTPLGSAEVGVACRIQPSPASAGEDAFTSTGDVVDAHPVSRTVRCGLLQSEASVASGSAQKGLW